MSLLIAGLGGSLMTPSASLSALRTALSSAAHAGANVELLDIRDLALPWYGASGADSCPSVARLAQVVAEADGMIWSSPMYHGTVSGAFKNAVDWLEVLTDRDPPLLTGKPVGLIATAAGAQGLQAINTMDFAVRALRGWTVPFSVPVCGLGLDYHGTIADDPTIGRLRSLGHMVVDAVHRFTA